MILEIEKREYYYESQDEIKNFRSSNKDKRNESYKNRREKELNSKIASNLRSRTSFTFKSQNIRKSNKTISL